ncbi:aromatic ring-opening dioxygenase LigA [Xylanimonas oleitrophica]|uniref:aromatic ring-opening dioxygenase LigA n=1 Tax=Xylanimonas oleitrophica TaxID=2607479 RepID=UPI00268FB3CA
MSSTVTVRPTGGVRGIGLVSILAGLLMILAGVGVWVLVASQLADEDITVAEDARFLDGQPVRGPLTAYAQADIINHHALAESGGRTYAELEQGDPLREVVMTASFLRASLFTSVVAFGLCALVVALGVLFVLLGTALRRLAGRPEVSVSAPEHPVPAAGGVAGRHADPASAQPPVATPRPSGADGPG